MTLSNIATDPVALGHSARDYFLNGDKANASGFDSAVLMFLMIGTTPLAITTTKGSDEFTVSTNVWELWGDPKGKIEKCLSENGKVTNVTAAVRTAFVSLYLGLDFKNEKGAFRAIDGNFKTRLQDAAICAAYLDAYVDDDGITGANGKPWMWALAQRTKQVGGRKVTRQALGVPFGALHPVGEKDGEELEQVKRNNRSICVWLDNSTHHNQKRSAEALKKLARASFGIKASAPEKDKDKGSVTSLTQALSVSRSGLKALLSESADSDKVASLSPKDVEALADIMALGQKWFAAEREEEGKKAANF